MVRRRLTLIFNVIIVLVLLVLLQSFSVFALTVGVDPSTLNGEGSTTLNINKVAGENIAIEIPSSANIALVYPIDKGVTDPSTLVQGQAATHSLINLNNGNKVMIIISNDVDTTVRAVVSVIESSTFNVYHLPSYISEEQYLTMSDATYSSELYGNLDTPTTGNVIVNNIPQSPPTAQSIVKYVILGEKETITLSEVSADDPDGDNLKLIFQNIGAPCTLDISSKSFSYQAPNDVVTEICSFQIKDEQGLFSSVQQVTFNAIVWDGGSGGDGGAGPGVGPGGGIGTGTINGSSNDTQPTNGTSGDYDDTDCPAFPPYILLEDRLTKNGISKIFFDLRGYIWDEHPDYLLGDIFGCNLGAIPTIYSFDFINSDPTDKYYCFGSDPNTNYKSEIGCWTAENNVNNNDDFGLTFDHKPIDKSGKYWNYEYNRSWEMYTEDETSYTIELYSSTLSREQLYTWVRGTFNSQYKIDVNTTSSSQSTGWKDSPLEWDIASITRALEEFDISDIMSITLSAKSKDGNLAGVLFDDLKTHSEWYNLSIVSQSDQNVVDCNLENNRYLNCTPYSLGDSVIELEILNLEGLTSKNNFTFTVENTLPKVNSVNFVQPLTSSNIVAQILGWEDPDGHPPLYRIEWYVDQVLQTSYLSSDILQTFNGNINPNQEVSIVVTAVDPFGDGNTVSTVNIISNSPPIIIKFDSNSPIGNPLDCDDTVTFDIIGSDIDAQILFFNLDYGDGDSVQFTSSPGDQKTVSHVYNPLSVQSFYTTKLNVSDGINIISSDVQIELSCNKLNPPSKPDSVSNIKGTLDVNNAGIELSWDSPNSLSDAIVICSLDSINENTDLSSTSPEFLAACDPNNPNIIGLNGNETSYLIHPNGESYYKVGTIAVNQFTNAYEISLSNKTIGVYNIQLIASDEYQWISLPLLPEGNSIEYLLSSIGNGKGKDNSLYICGFSDYNGDVSEVRYFNINSYKSSISSGNGEDESVKDANLLYKPNIDCRYYASGLFDTLQDMSVNNGYWIKVDQDTELIIVGDVMTSISVPIVESLNNKTAWIGYPFVYPTSNNINPNNAIVEHFNIGEYKQLINSGQSKTNALSSAYKINLPGQTKQIDKFEPGKGYRILSNQNTNIVLDHPKK